MKTRLFALVAVVAMLLMAAIGSGPAASQARLTIAAGPAPWPGLPLLRELARQISRNIPNVEAAVEVTASVAENMRLISAQRADMGYAGGPVVKDAFLGQGAFSGNPVPVRTLTPLWNIVFHLVTLEGAGINTVTDLKGKRVGTGPQGGPEERDSIRILRAAGIDPERDVRLERLTPGATVVALREKRVDAFFSAWVTAPPNPLAFELATTPGMRIRLIPLDVVVQTLQREFGNIFLKTTIQREFYPGIPADVPTIAGNFLLVAHQNFSTDLAYQVTKLLYEKRGELAQAAREAQYVTLIGVASRSSIPFHPGAIRYFQERAVEGF